MERKTIYMPKKLWDQVDSLARFFSREEDRKISGSEVIRRALVELSFKYEKFKTKGRKK